MTFDIETTRRDLIAMRTKHGAESPIGHRCSNVIEQLQEFEASGRTSLIPLIQKQMAGLAKLSAKNAENREAP